MNGPSPQKPYFECGGVTLYHGDCLAVLPLLAYGSADMVFADLPYGTTYCPWDAVIPPPPLWAQFGRLTAGTMVFTSCQPFTTTPLAAAAPSWRQRRAAGIESDERYCETAARRLDGALVSGVGAAGGVPTAVATPD